MEVARSLYFRLIRKSVVIFKTEEQKESVQSVKSVVFILQETKSRKSDNP